MADRYDLLPAGQPVPPGLETGDFYLEPLTTAHTLRDYAALMESRAQLRLWSGSPWPQDDFTPEDNRRDLARHAREHRQRIAFTYTVLDPAGAQCLGCVYILSLARMVAAQSADREQQVSVSPHEAAIRFWVTTPSLGRGMEPRLLHALQRWFAGQWPFSSYYYHTRRANKRQMASFHDARLHPTFDLVLPGRGGPHTFWQG